LTGGVDKYLVDFAHSHGVGENVFLVGEEEQRLFRVKLKSSAEEKKSQLFPTISTSFLMTSE